MSDEESPRRILGPHKEFSEKELREIGLSDND